MWDLDCTGEIGPAGCVEDVTKKVSTSTNPYLDTHTWGREERACYSRNSVADPMTAILKLCNNVMIFASERAKKTGGEKETCTRCG